MKNKNDQKPQKGELHSNDPLGDLKKIWSDYKKKISKETIKKTDNEKWTSSSPLHWRIGIHFEINHGILVYPGIQNTRPSNVYNCLHGNTTKNLEFDIEPSQKKHSRKGRLVMYTSNLIQYCNSGNAGKCPKCGYDLEVKKVRTPIRENIILSCKKCGKSNVFLGTVTKK